MMAELKTLWKRALCRLTNGSEDVLSPADAYDRWAARYGTRMNPLQELEEAALCSLLPDLSGRAVLDIGCGTGRVSSIALDRGAASIVGVDLSPAMLNEAHARSDPSITFAKGDACALPFDASSFDVVLCSLVLGHVERLDDALSEINRVLRPGGRVVITGFHPFATLRGWNRTFHDTVNGRTYAIVQHIHLFEDYFRGFRRHGWNMEAFEEPLYKGYPAAFVLRAQKEGAR